MYKKIRRPGRWAYVYIHLVTVFKKSIFSFQFNLVDHFKRIKKYQCLQKHWREQRADTPKWHDPNCTSWARERAGSFFPLILWCEENVATADFTPWGQNPQNFQSPFLPILPSELPRAPVDLWLSVSLSDANSSDLRCRMMTASAFSFILHLTICSFNRHSLSKALGTSKWLRQNLSLGTSLLEGGMRSGLDTWTTSTCCN